MILQSEVQHPTFTLASHCMTSVICQVYTFTIVYFVLYILMW